ncbi:unnamed protein product [Owenia fusiformis]|uniref:Phosphodiester glycosidase domain-containing protein n=1 Tax=Owenia fusiformis TaxID=6347 RepID=A0A8S4Q5D8_OWEFU|nr:unnamed protein product [Owenia fusiformis]
MSFILWICIIGFLVQPGKSQDEDLMDILLPYSSFARGPHFSHRHVRDCQPVKYGNVTHETTLPGAKNDSVPLIETKYFTTPNEISQGHVTFVQDPARHVSVLEPGKEGGCTAENDGNYTRATVAKSGERKKCLVAVNAGFFNTTTGDCYGNVVSDGKLAKDGKGIQNSHFGVKKNGELYFGYVTEEEVLSGDFDQLVAGVLWLVRNGEIYVNESEKAECADTQETGTLNTFINVLSARAAVGVDAMGRLVIAHVDGRTRSRGMTLHDFAQLLIDFGVVNAINLDGGGSMTYVSNGTVINYPSDYCSRDSKLYRCPRRVSTIVCVHDGGNTPVETTDAPNEATQTQSGMALLIVIYLVSCLINGL